MDFDSYDMDPPKEKLDADKIRELAIGEETEFVQNLLQNPYAGYNIELEAKDVRGVVELLNESDQKMRTMAQNVIAAKEESMIDVIDQSGIYSMIKAMFDSEDDKKAADGLIMISMLKNHSRKICETGLVPHIGSFLTHPDDDMKLGALMAFYGLVSALSSIADLTLGNEPEPGTRPVDYIISSGIVDKVPNMLDHQMVDIRIQSAELLRALVEEGGADAIDLLEGLDQKLMHLLDDDDFDVRASATSALEAMARESGGERIVARFMEMLGSENLMVRASTAVAIAHLSDKKFDALKEMGASIAVSVNITLEQAQGIVELLDNDETRSDASIAIGQLSLNGSAERFVEAGVLDKLKGELEGHEPNLMVFETIGKIGHGGCVEAIYISGLFEKALDAMENSPDYEVVNVLSFFTGMANGGGVGRIVESGALEAIIEQLHNDVTRQQALSCMEGIIDNGGVELFSKPEMIGTLKNILLEEGMEWDGLNLMIHLAQAGGTEAIAGPDVLRPVVRLMLDPGDQALAGGLITLMLQAGHSQDLVDSSAISVLKEMMENENNVPLALDLLGRLAVAGHSKLIIDDLMFKKVCEYLDNQLYSESATYFMGNMAQAGEHAALIEAGVLDKLKEMTKMEEQSKALAPVVALTMFHIYGDRTHVEDIMPKNLEFMRSYPQGIKAMKIFYPEFLNDLLNEFPDLRALIEEEEE